MQPHAEAKKCALKVIIRRLSGPNTSREAVVQDARHCFMVSTFTQPDVGGDLPIHCRILPGILSCDSVRYRIDEAVMIRMAEIRYRVS